MVFFDFDDEPDGEDEPLLDPPTFKLFGRTWHCVPEYDGKQLLDMVAAIDGESPREQALAITRFYQHVICKDERTDFLTELDDPDKPIALAKLVKIVGVLTEQYVDRPTQQPVQLPVGRSPRGRTSTGGRGAKGSTSPRSRRATP
jgi:hypothetical protein